MKQTVIIFTGLHHFKPVDKSTPKGFYYEEALMEVVHKWFKSDRFDVNIIDFPKCRCFYNFEQIWKEVRLPVLIGYRDGANYIEPIKNFKRKYLISPSVYTDSFDESKEIDEYDEENTICLFGGDEKSVKNAYLYETLYPHTHYGLTDGKLDLCNGIDIAMIFETMRIIAKR
ncbi:MAG: hypothetical protein K2N48_13370 [Muribaculaceae bacterium]|nr:hypothetical protein [Muribaculaceae bacterium]